MEAIETGTLAGDELTPTIQDDAYGHDELGNVTSRSQLQAPGGAVVSESFTYDSLNRLWKTQLGTNAEQTISYDELGNIVGKPNVGIYSYPASGANSVRPHAVSSITGTVAGLTNPGFGYDANGNLELGLNRAYQWSAANYPTKIDKLTNGTKASATERDEFIYGPDRHKARQTVRAMSGQAEGAVKRTIYYGGAIEKEVDATQTKTFIRTYLPEGIGYVEEVVNSVSAAPGTAPNATKDRFFHTDHLGSLLVITDITGAQVQRMSYDAWGRRRQNSGADDSWAGLGTLANDQDNTGFTGQEQLDNVGLVHLNGRVYDPVSARMVSADPTVPDASDTQALNRYSYVVNSPLGYTDPTGFVYFNPETVIRNTSENWGQALQRAWEQATSDDQPKAECPADGCQSFPIVGERKPATVTLFGLASRAAVMNSGAIGAKPERSIGLRLARRVPYALLAEQVFNFMRAYDDGAFPLAPLDGAFPQAILMAGADQGQSSEVATANANAQRERWLYFFHGTDRTSALLLQGARR